MFVIAYFHQLSSAPYKSAQKSLCLKILTFCRNYFLFFTYSSYNTNFKTFFQHTITFSLQYLINNGLKCWVSWWHFRKMLQHLTPTPLFEAHVYFWKISTHPGMCLPPPKFMNLFVFCDPKNVAAYFERGSPRHLRNMYSKMSIRPAFNYVR